jgi:adenylate kinase
VNQFHPETEILVLDGIPRNVDQARLLDDTIEVVKVIYLVCADMSKMVERLRRRALKENRFDDANDQVIKHRLEVYERDTKPVLDHYSGEKIMRIDATMNQLQVLRAILDQIAPLKAQMDQAREAEEDARLVEAKR